MTEQTNAALPVSSAWPTYGLSGDYNVKVHVCNVAYILWQTNVLLMIPNSPRTHAWLKDENKVHDWVKEQCILRLIVPIIWSMCTLMRFNKDQMLKADRFMCAIRILENVKCKWTGIIQARLNNADSQSKGGKVWKEAVEEGKELRKTERKGRKGEEGKVFVKGADGRGHFSTEWDSSCHWWNIQHLFTTDQVCLCPLSLSMPF